MNCYSQVDFLHHYGSHAPVRINLQCYCIMLTILTFQACSIHLQFMFIHKTLMPSTSIALYFTLLTTQPIFLSKAVVICNTTNHQNATMHHDHAPPHSCSLKMCILSKLIIEKHWVKTFNISCSNLSILASHNAVVHLVTDIFP